MYGYYALGMCFKYFFKIKFIKKLLAALGPHIQKYLWWKKYITMLQLVQFGLLGVHWAYFVTFHKNYPAFYVINYALQVILYIILFTRFYLQTYHGAKKNTTQTIDNVVVSGTKKVE